MTLPVPNKPPPIVRPKKDEIESAGRWTFDADVTGVFDDMLERSIPDYETMRSLTYQLGRKFVERLPSAAVVDIGASRGNAIAPFVDGFGAVNRFVAVEISNPMADVLDQRFEGYIKAGIFRVSRTDVRKAIPDFYAALVLSILTLQFTPIEYRLSILRKIYNNMAPGGALILVEKILGATAEFDESFVDLYLNMKRENGYTDDQIERKRLSLEGVLVPVTARMNEEFLHATGFKDVDCFWRWANFAGWIAVK